MAARQITGRRLYAESRSMKRFLSLCLALFLVFPAFAHKKEKHSSEDERQILAPGYRPLEYEAPPAGSYQLPRLSKAADGTVLDTDGNQISLAKYFSSNVTILAFIYGSCDDVNGCPLTDFVLRQVQKHLSAQPEFANRLNILSLSFDPARDTPESLRDLQRSVARIDKPVWRYLTTSGYSELDPILQNYQQSVVREVDGSGTETGNLSHILRVFLIDTAGYVRNIYSTSFLHAETLANDVITLLLEDEPFAAEKNTLDNQDDSYTPGDDKSGYEQSGYVTRSKALPRRQGDAIDLIAHANKTRVGLLSVPLPDGASLEPDIVKLGRRLFFDRRLSLNNTISCAMCHIPEQGFASNELATAVGVEGRTVRRNAPTLLNVGYLDRLFHDGREFSLENQIWAPLFASNEMAVPSPGFLLNKLESFEEYRKGFLQAFGENSILMRNVGVALASYQRTLVAANSPFDMWYYGGDDNAVEDSVRRGFELFVSKAGCATCHIVGAHQALFSDSAMHNTGIGYARSMKPEAETTRVQLAPGVFVDVDRESYSAAAEKIKPDLGYYEITQDPNDRWKYRTPTLRNVALTPPYMHDGSLKSLSEVVSFYNKGGEPNEVLDPLIKPLNLTEKEMSDLVDFMQSLTSNEVNTLVSDAFAAPIGDIDNSQ